MSSQRALSRICCHLLDLPGELDAELVHQDLDARLVDAVAAAVLVIDAKDRLDIAQISRPCTNGLMVLR